MKKIVKLLSIGLMSMSLFACSNKKINPIEKENIFLSIFFGLVLLFSISTLIFF